MFMMLLEYYDPVQTACATLSELGASAWVAGTVLEGMPERVEEKQRRESKMDIMGQENVNVTRR